MKRFLLPFLMVCAIVALLMGIAPANASLVLLLDDPAVGDFADVVLIDNQPAGAVSTGGGDWVPTVADYTSTLGAIYYVSEMPGGSVWTVTVTGVLSKPYYEPGKMTLKSVSVSSTGAGVLNLYGFDTDFTFGGAGSAQVLEYYWGGTTEGTIVAQAGLDFDNLEFGVATYEVVTPFEGPLGPGSFSGTVSSAPFVTTANPYSLYEYVQITHTGAGQVTSFTKHGSVVGVPEPATMLLLGSGLVGLVGFRRRFRM
jgi:hypothetical protein